LFFNGMVANGTCAGTVFFTLDLSRMPGGLALSC